MTTYPQKISFSELRASGVPSRAAGRSLDGNPVARERRRYRLGFNGAGDPGRVVQELHYHMPRIVENQQRLGPIVGQLACNHYGLEPQMNGFF